jgi:catechol 2,3-dioxygenase-like lactoylglutathione lyase family enzyme
MPKDRPVLDQVNVVVRDMDAAVTFYRRLGLEIADTAPHWDPHHRSAVTARGVDLDIDSSAFAQRWDEGRIAGTTGVVVGFRVEARETVDAIYGDLVAHGAVGRQPPWDAFWGARYAIVEDPDGNPVGIMSAMDPTRRTPAPDPDATG